MGMMAGAMAVMAVSTAASTYAAYAAGSARRTMARHNARVARVAAQDAYKRGQAEEARHRYKVGALLGRQRAAMGASGAAVGEGTLADIEADTLAMGELDALTIRNNAAREVWGLEQRGATYGLEAAFAKREAKMGAISSALGGTAQILGMKAAGSAAQGGQ